MKLVGSRSSKRGNNRYNKVTKPRQSIVEENSPNQHHVDQRSNSQRKQKSSASKVLVALLIVLVLAATGFGGWYYWWTTYATFDYHVRPIVILEGEVVEAGDFLSIYTDTTLVSATFTSNEIATAPGQHYVSILLSRGWRSLETLSSLYILTSINSISHEFAAPGQELSALDFIANTDVASDVYFNVGFSHEPLRLEDYAVGEHILHLYLNYAEFDVTLTVYDTTPPTAVAVNYDIRIGEEVTPENFVTDIFDASPIASIAFVVEPDVFARQSQNVEVVIEDIFGNYAIFSSTLYIELNQTPPTIEGTDTIITRVGTPILYLTNVTAYDDFGRELEVNVDSSNVDQHTVGIYSALYYVYDFSGQRTEVEIDVHVVDIDIEYVHQRVDEALSQILNDGMTQLEQAKAIHNWVRHNVSYAIVRGGPETAYEGAYIALRNRRGNCFIFYSISEVMLTRAGIPNMRIERIPGTRTTHRWNLINPDNLGWHHFDTFPTRIGQGPQFAFFTSSQAADFARRIQAINNMRNYYTYDPELYPDIVWD